MVIALSNLKATVRVKTTLFQAHAIIMDVVLFGTWFGCYSDDQMSNGYQSLYPQTIC